MHTIHNLCKWKLIKNNVHIKLESYTHFILLFGSKIAYQLLYIKFKKWGIMRLLKGLALSMGQYITSLGAT
jgi:hypothetical protein